MTSLRPYLLRAVIDWIVDNDHTPHMVIDCAVPGVEAPTEYAQRGKLTLNISPAAVRGFSLGDEHVALDCRFRGRSTHISAPVGAVVALYAKETGLGMAFEPERGEPGEPGEPGKTPKPRRPSPKKPAERPKLTLVK